MGRHARDRTQHDAPETPGAAFPRASPGLARLSNIPCAEAFASGALGLHVLRSKRGSVNGVFFQLGPRAVSLLSAALLISLWKRALSDHGLAEMS